MTMIRSAANCVRRVNARCVRDSRASRDDESPVADAVRQEFTAHLAPERADADADDAARSAHGESIARALQAARQAVLAMRANDEIGDDAFHRIEEELDWLEMAGHTRQS